MEEVLTPIFLCHKDSEYVVLYILGRVNDLLLDDELSFFLLLPRLLVLTRVLKFLLLYDFHGLVLEERSYRDFTMVAEKLNYL